MITKLLIAATAAATLAIAATPAWSAHTVFGDRLEGIAAAITGNFLTPEPFRPSSALLQGSQPADGVRSS